MTTATTNGFEPWTTREASPDDGVPHTAEAEADHRAEAPRLAWLEEALRRDTYTFASDDLDVEPEPVSCLWGKYIVAGEVNVLTGPGGSGKSSLLTGLALAGAIGQSFLGRPTQQFETVIFTTEDGVDDYKRKLHAWKDSYLGAWRQANGRIHIIPLKGIPLRLIDAGFGQVNVAPGVVEALAARTRELVPSGEVLILVETVSRVSGGDESNSGAGMLVVALERLSFLTKGGTPLPVAHVGKENARSRQTDMYAGRGGSALADNARSVLVLTRPPEKVLKKNGFDLESEPDYLFILSHAKHNRTPQEPDLLLRRESGKCAAYFETWRQQKRPEAFVEETEEESRARIGERLKDVVRHAREGDGVKAVTERRLRDDYLHRLGLTKDALPLAVDRAVKDRWLAREEKSRGGGKGTLRPGPRTREKWPEGSGREVAETGPDHFDDPPDSPTGEVAGAYKQGDSPATSSALLRRKWPETGRAGSGTPETGSEKGEAGPRKDSLGRRLCDFGDCPHHGVWEHPTVQGWLLCRPHRDALTARSA